jgi:hypothetical protein
MENKPREEISMSDQDLTQFPAPGSDEPAMSLDEALRPAEEKRQARKVGGDD